MIEPAALLAAIRPIAEEAGRATMRFYGLTEATEKADGSPVTAADQAAEDIILPALRHLTPDIPVVSEEEASQGLSPQLTGDRFWLVDPLDGTREFLSGNGEFTINIALIEGGAPWVWSSSRHAGRLIPGRHQAPPCWRIKRVSGAFMCVRCHRKGPRWSARAAMAMRRP